MQRSRLIEVTFFCCLWERLNFRSVQILADPHQNRPWVRLHKTFALPPSSMPCLSLWCEPCESWSRFYLAFMAKCLFYCLWKRHKVVGIWALHRSGLKRYLVPSCLSPPQLQVKSQVKMSPQYWCVTPLWCPPPCMVMMWSHLAFGAKSLGFFLFFFSKSQSCSNCVSYPKFYFGQNRQ